MFTIQWIGWQGKENGELLSLMEKENFDIFITADKNLRYQQNLSGYHVAVILLKVARLWMEDIEPLIPEIRHRFDFIQAGKFYEIGN